MNTIHTKAFLNLDGYHSTASILVALSPKSMDIIITDCNEKVSLRQTMRDEGDVENALFKVNVLIATLSSLVVPLTNNLKELRSTKKIITTTVTAKTADKKKAQIVTEGAIFLDMVEGTQVYTQKVGSSIVKYHFILLQNGKVKIKTIKELNEI